MRMADLKLLHVPYKGSGPALTDLLGSQVDSMMDQLTASIGHIKEGRIRPLAISSRSRSPQLPNVPTLDETRRRPVTKRARSPESSLRPARRSRCSRS
jgi:tripartite-type tricarboxylate transporter receptor subunit TctC